MATQHDWLGRTPWDKVTLIVSTLGLLVTFAGAIRRLLSCRVRALSHALLQRLCERIAGSCAEPSDHDVRRLVRDRILELRTAWMRMTICTINVLSMLVGISIIYHIVSGAERVLSPGIDTLHLIYQPYAVATMLFPNLITADNLDGHFAFLLLFSAAVVSPPTQPNMATVLGINVAVVSLNFAKGTTSRWRFPSFLLCNMCFIASGSLSLMRSADFCIPGAMGGWFWFCAEFLGMSSSCVFAYFLEENLRRTVGQSLQLQEVRQLHSAACALLRSCCDVVVELDAERKILSPEPDLGSYLMRGMVLQGKVLDELILDEEGQRAFGEKISQAPQDEPQGLAETMQVSLKDGWGNAVRVELLWFQFQRPDGQAHFMLGIRDFGEGAHPPGRARGAHAAADGVDSFPARDAPSLGMDCVDDFEVMAVVDCEQQGYPIRSLTAGFRNQIGRLPQGSPFLSHVSKPQRFLLWVQDSLNLAFNGEEPSDCHVTFKMPQGRVATRCHMELSTSGLDISNVSLSFVRRAPSEAGSGEEAAATSPPRRGTPPAGGARSPGSGEMTPSEASGSFQTVSL